MIKKKDLNFGFDGRNSTEKKESKSLNRLAHNKQIEYKAPQTANLNHIGLHLTGVQIENPNKEAFKTPHVTKELIVRKSSPVKRVDMQTQARFRKSKKRDEVAKHSMEPNSIITTKIP